MKQHPAPTTVEFDAGRGKQKWRIHDGTICGKWWSKAGQWLEPTIKNIRHYATFTSHEKALAVLETIPQPQ